MGGTEPRVLAVTTSASLVIGLMFSHRGWDVASQTPDAATPLDGDVVVLDLGTTRAGLGAARRLEPEGRAVVIGDEEPTVATPPCSRVLVRPYTVDDLTDCIDQLLSPTSGQPTSSVDPARSERVEPGVGGSSSDVGLDAPAEDADAGDDRPPARSAATSGMPASPETAGQAPTVTDEPAGSEQPATDASSSGDRGRRVDRSGSRRSLTSRLFGRVADTTSRQPESVAAPTGVLDAPELELPEEPGDDIEAAEDDHELPVAPQPSPPPLPTPATPAPAAASTLLERRVIHVAQPASSAPPAVRPTRWRARRQKLGTAPERRLRERLARVLSATSELELLVGEVPLLNELPALAWAIVREVQHQLDADTVGLWRPDDQGWRVAAHRGLTLNEETWIVPFDQPLFAEVHATGGALLLDPVDAVQAAVAGIGGAHTESFMAAAVAAGPGRYGILAVGRDRQLVEEDLDILGDLALEMAPGLAVAEQLERLRGTGSMAAPAESGGDDRRPWRTAD